VVWVVFDGSDESVSVNTDIGCVFVQSDRCSEEGEDKAATTSIEHRRDVKSSQFGTW